MPFPSSNKTMERKKTPPWKPESISQCQHQQHSHSFQDWEHWVFFYSEFICVRKQNLGFDEKSFHLIIGFSFIFMGFHSTPGDSYIWVIDSPIWIKHLGQTTMLCQSQTSPLMKYCNTCWKSKCTELKNISFRWRLKI